MNKGIWNAREMYWVSLALNDKLTGAKYDAWSRDRVMGNIAWCTLNTL